MDYLPLNTLTVSLTGAAVIFTTFFRNIFNLQRGVGKTVKLRRDILYDEGFSVLKFFFAKASLHTVEDLQTFGNNFVPSPFWVRVIRVNIPLSTRLDAGQVIIDTLGEDEIERVVGGREWWQRNAGKEGGIEGEWISMKKDWEGLETEDESDEANDKVRVETLQRMKEGARRRDKKAKSDARKQEKRRRKEEKEESDRKNGVMPDATASGAEDSDSDTDEEAESERGERVGDDEETYSPEMDEMRCILYIHGGAYFFGSINTHRYSIWRYARKIGGRAFSINYRLAPQYPFPCALSDALAAYLYLIRPPPGAKHKPVDPARLTLAGDSAGGGLCLALLCLIRDSGLPLPAGAMLISPWCDLTHSFPSILTNTETDVVPPYGFLFKPSTLWPPPPADFQERANRSTSLDGVKEAQAKKEQKKQHSPLASIFNADKKGKDLAKNVAGDGTDLSSTDPLGGDPKRAEGDVKGGETAEVGHILKIKVDGEEVEVRDQIQLYATNEQLVYPYVSPILHPSLGGLPPLYVMCGDKEVLRDEIIYMAHRAANPEKYPLRKTLLDANPERAKKAANYPPTKVHLQVYDDVCHDLPLLSFTTPAKYCYRAISSFAKFVTADQDASIPSPVSATGMHLPAELASSSADIPSGSSTPPSSSNTPTSPNFLQLPTPNTAKSTSSDNSSTGSTRSRALKFGSAGSKKSSKNVPDLSATIYSSLQPFNRPPWVDNMVRERIGIDGVVRPLEPAEELQAMQLSPEEVGLLKEAPVKRYLAGKAIWDKRFKRTYEHVQRRREHHLKKSVAEEANRIKKRLKSVKKKEASRRPSLISLTSTSRRPSAVSLPGEQFTDSPEPIDGYEGIWNLHGEHPPPSSIAARKDTMEARKLARVLDEHYSKLHALHLWSDVQDIGAAGADRLNNPTREASAGEDMEVLRPGPSI
ncbi:alpha/beta-hydrolase [Meredithblackwellia eburnea MCA 4105]